MAGDSSCGSRSHGALRRLLRSICVVPTRDCKEMSSSFATEAYGPGACISRPSTGRPRTRASRARHGSGMRPTADFPCLSAGSIREARDRPLVALPCFAISYAKRLKTRTMPTKYCFRLNDLHRAKQAWPQQTSNARSLSRSRRRDGPCRNAKFSW
jgi:hypothetical protein